MTNKLVVIINILKVPKIKKILLYEIKLLLPILRCVIPVVHLNYTVKWIPQQQQQKLWLNDGAY
jgi:hypothetical protein